jgi:hypothetical protein
MSAWDQLSDDGQLSDRSRSPPPTVQRPKHPPSQLTRNESADTIQRLTPLALHSHMELFDAATSSSSVAASDSTLCPQGLYQVRVDTGTELPPPTYDPGAQWWQQPLRNAGLASSAAHAMRFRPRYPMNHVSPFGGLMTQMFGPEAPL